MGNENLGRAIGASNLTKSDRQVDDFYATEPLATELLLEEEQFHKNILEPCCGNGAMAKVLELNGYNVTATDLIDRGYGKGNVNFLTDHTHFSGDIITNPPFKLLNEIILHGLNIIDEGNKLAIFGKVQMLESVDRGKIFKEHPPKTVYVSPARLNCAKDGRFDLYTSSAMCYIWIVWQKGYKGDTVIKWFNNFGGRKSKLSNEEVTAGKKNEVSEIDLFSI